MTTPTNDALVNAQRRQAQSLRQMTGVSAQTVRTVEASIARPGVDDPVFNLMARLCTHAALEDTAFFEAAAIRAAAVRQSVQRALELIAALSDGASAILLWSTDSRAPREPLPELQQLLDDVNRARFARNAIAETVDDGVVAQARLAALELAERLRSEDPAELPTRDQLERVVEEVASVATLVSEWLGMRSQFQNQRFRDVALLRVLENADVFLTTLQERIDGGDRDVDAEAEALAVISNLEAVAESLVADREVFGNLLVREATIQPEEANVVLTAFLRPVAERIREARVISGRVVDGTTPDTRIVELVPPGTWNDSEDFMQSVAVAHDESAYYFAEAVVEDPVVFEGTATVDGAAITAIGFPIGNEITPGDRIRVRKISGSGGAFDSVLTVLSRGVIGVSTPYQEAFATTFTSTITTETDWVVEWELLGDASTTTDRVSIPASSLTSEIPDSELVNELVIVRFGTTSWSHRFITAATTRDDGSRLLEFDVAVPIDEDLTVLRFANQAFPNSQYVRVAATGGERLDLRVGDTLVDESTGSTETYRVLHAFGDVAVVDRPLHTTPEYRVVQDGGGPRIGGPHAVQVSTSPWVFRPMLRTRGVQLRDRIVALPVQSASTGFTSPSGREEYRVIGYSTAGFICEVVGTESTDALPRSYDRFAVIPGDLDSQTNLVELVDGQGEVIALSDLDRTARRIRAAEDPENQLDDTFPLRSITVILNGEPLDARRSGDTFLRLSTRVPLQLFDVPVRISCRLDTQSRRGVITITDDFLRDGFVPSPAFDISGATLLDLDSRIPYGIVSGTVASGATSATTLFVDEITTDLRGPIGLGGPPEYLSWAYVESFLTRVETPDLSELREDLGRALADLGTVGGRSFAGEVTEVLDPDEATIRITFTDIPPTAGIVVGADVVLAGESRPPIRIVSVESPETVSPTEVIATVTRAPQTVPAATTIRDTTIAQAWRELRSVTTYLDTINTLLEQIQAPEVQQINRIAAQLESRGYTFASQVVRACNFAKWVDLVGLSNRTDLADRVDALVASVLTRRNAPMDL